MQQYGQWYDIMKIQNGSAQEIQKRMSTGTTQCDLYTFLYFLSVIQFSSIFCSVLFYPTIRMWPSNTCFFFFSCFFCGHLLQTSSFCSAKQILIASFAVQVRACILSDHNIFYTLRVWRTMAGLMSLGKLCVFPVVVG